ncbi:MAG: lysophospholipid acyltransferase family protein [SAR324 cluster bacterium]|nr:lysophospholipid acyltransferase family protein [SAR324 cluster bacterium]
MIPSIGKGFGKLLFISGIRRKVVQRNLEIAFSNSKDVNERKRLSQRTYQNYGIVLLELLLLKYIPLGNLSNYIKIEGLDILASAIAEGKGVVLAGNHFGNWELLSAAISTLGSPIHIYAGKQRNGLFDGALNRIRHRFGTITISKTKTATMATIEMMKVLKNAQVLALAGDLNVPHNTLFVDFFGKQAVIGRGLASLALSREAPLLFAWCVRTGPLKHAGHLCRVQYTPTGDKEADLRTISQSLTRILEQKIRENPDQYFWFNKRWKTRPAEETGPDIY